MRDWSSDPDGMNNHLRFHPNGVKAKVGEDEEEGDSG